MRSTKFGLMRWVPADRGAQRQEQAQKLRGKVDATQPQAAANSGDDDPGGDDDDPGGDSSRKRPRCSSAAATPAGSPGQNGSAGTSSLSFEFARGEGCDAMRDAFSSFSSYGDAEGDSEIGRVPVSGGGDGAPRQLTRYGEPKYCPGDDPYNFGGMWLVVSVLNLLNCCTLTGPIIARSLSHLPSINRHQQPGPRRGAPLLR
jgi:hypothetical protein